MKILFVTIAWPDAGSENLYSELLKKFRDERHEVYVACSSQRRKGKETSCELEEGMQVLRIKTGNISKTGHLEKSISLLLLNFQFKRAIYNYLGDEDFDLILFNTPPITMSGLLEKLKHKYACPVYLLLKDIWPYGFADLGVIKQGGLVWKFFRHHEKKIYDTADYIGCMSPAGVSFVVDKNPQIDPAKVEVCPNSIRLPVRDFKPDQNIRSKYGIPDDATVFLFSGNLGKGHGLDFLTRCINELNNYEKAFFLIGGAGTHFEKVKKDFNKYDPQNALLYSYLPREDFDNLLGICDVGLILLDSRYTYPQFPSRLLAYLKAKMAVFCAVNKDTDIGDIVEDVNAGLQVEHGDTESFLQAVKKLSENKEMTEQMGTNAFDLLKNRYTVQHSYEVIMSHFE